MRHIAIWNVNENKVASFETISGQPHSKTLREIDDHQISARFWSAAVLSLSQNISIQTPVVAFREPALSIFSLADRARAPLRLKGLLEG